MNEASQLSAEIGVESPRPVRVRSRSETDRRHRLDGLVLGNCVRACTTRNPSDSRATQVGSLPFRGPARVARDTSSTFVRSLHRRSSGRSCRASPWRPDPLYRRVPTRPPDPDRSDRVWLQLLYRHRFRRNPAISSTPRRACTEECSVSHHRSSASRHRTPTHLLPRYQSYGSAVDRRSSILSITATAEPRPLIERTPKRDGEPHERQGTRAEGAGLLGVF